MKKKLEHAYEQVVFFLQGGGALGAYQVGVCQGLLQAGINPDWLIGTSIGGINASIIAGNKPENRVNKLMEFWDRISASVPAIPLPKGNAFLEKSINFYTAQHVAMFGLPGFFKPRSYNPWYVFSGEANQLSYYDTSELYDTLTQVIDFDIINQRKTRLTLGTVHAGSGKDVYFDNFYQDIGPEHIMASAALPPGFPAIKINNEYYWDGGVSSNTPFSVVLDEKIPKRLLCFIVNLFAFPEHSPTSMMEVLKTKKELEYASRHQEILHSFLELHLLQRTINVLPKGKNLSPEIRSILQKVAILGHPTSLNIIRFHYRDQPTNLVSSDLNFSPFILKQHWKSGQDDVGKALKQSSLFEKKVGDSGAIIHEF